MDFIRFWFNPLLKNEGDVATCHEALSFTSVQLGTHICIHGYCIAYIGSTIPHLGPSFPVYQPFSEKEIVSITAFFDLHCKR